MTPMVHGHGKLFKNILCCYINVLMYANSLDLTRILYEYSHLGHYINILT